MSKLLKTGSLLLLGSALVACGNAQGANSSEAPEKIVVAQMPNEENPNTPTLHAQFREHLAEELGIEVVEVESTNYAVGIEALASGNVDVMLVSPMSYYQAREKAGAELLVSQTSDMDYYTAFVTHVDNDHINSIEDLEGTNFAFVDQSSSSGYLYPKGTLVNELELDPEQVENGGYFFNNIAYSGSHDTSAIGVAMKDYDAAAVAGMVLAGLEQAGIIEEGSLKEIGRSVDIPNPAYVIRGDLPEEFKQEVLDAFLSFDDEEYFEAMYGNGETRFEAVPEDYYDASLEVLESINALGGE